MPKEIKHESGTRAITIEYPATLTGVNDKPHAPKANPSETKAFVIIRRFIREVIIKGVFTFFLYDSIKNNMPNPKKNT